MSKPNESDSSIDALSHLSLAELMTDVNRVACVDTENSLEHALLILIKSGYSAVPVVERGGRVVGTISKTRILDSILGLERIEFETLEGRHVADAMNSEVPRISLHDGFLKATELSIDAPFLCVEDTDGRFVGIVTRRTMLSKLYRYIKSELRSTV